MAGLADHRTEVMPISRLYRALAHALLRPRPGPCKLRATIPPRVRAADPARALSARCGDGLGLPSCRDQSRSGIHFIRGVRRTQQQDFFEAPQSLRWLFGAQQHTSQAGQHLPDRPNSLSHSESACDSREPPPETIRSRIQRLSEPVRSCDHAGAALVHAMQPDFPAVPRYLPVPAAA